MAKKLNLSIIVMSYNEEKNIINTIKDILTNLPTNKYYYEIIIMDDGSSDNTKKIVKNFIKTKKIFSKFIKYHYNKKNLGQFRNIETGVKISSNYFISIIPGDGQILMKGFLENFKKMSKNEIFYGYPVNEVYGRGAFRAFVSHLWRIFLHLLFNIRAIYLAGLIIIPKKIFKITNIEFKNFFGLYELGIALNQSNTLIIQGPFYLKKREYGKSGSLSLKLIFQAPIFFYKTFNKYKKRGLFKEGYLIKKLNKKLKNLT